MPEATFWFASPFREWIGQRSLTVSWEGRITLREIWERLAADYPKVRANLPREGIQEEAMSHLTAVIVDGDILTLDSVIRDGAKVDILTPLSGGREQEAIGAPIAYRPFGRQWVPGTSALGGEPRARPPRRARTRAFPKYQSA